MPTVRISADTGATVSPGPASEVAAVSGDTSAVRTRLSSRRFVGRVGELAELELAVREATSGRPTLVLLGGDSGVGKTRLVAELRARLRSPATDSAGPADDPAPVPLILSGDAVQPAEGELPYAALVGALRPLVRERDPVFTTLHPTTRAPLATLLPGLDDGAGVAVPELRGGEAADQLRLFESILALLDGLSERAPVVLILEDLHWADPSTRGFVAFLARSLRSERVAVIVTYRTDELYRRHPLRPLLAELGRLERARAIELEPLDRQELSDALTDILGATPDSPLLERLYTRTEGNPLYTEELLAAGLDGRGAPPRSLSDAFLGRIERLTPEAQQLARALSLGRALDEAALSAVTGLAGDWLHAALREAVAEQVLVASAGGSFGFRHALLREALYDDLLPGERGALHTALARHLESEAALGDEPAQRLQRLLAIAHHHLAAGDQPAGLRTSVAAADAARVGHAADEAAELYGRALELWPRVPDPESLTGIDHVTLLWQAARTSSVRGERARADSLLRQALADLDPDADRVRYASVLAERGRVLWTLNRGAEAVSLGERALELIPDADPGCDRAAISGWLARLQYLRGRPREARAEGEAALAAARAAGDRLAETELLNTLGMAKVSLGEVEAGLASLREAIALARRREDVDSLAAATSNLADMLMLVGRVGEAVRTAQAGLAEIPQSHRRNRDWLTLTLSELAFQAGDWALARECLSLPAERMGGIITIFGHTREAELAAGAGEDERALASLDAVAELVAASSEPQWISVYGTVRAEVHARRGELELAQAAVRDAVDRMEVCTDDIARIAAVSLAGVRVEADRAQRARDLGEPAVRRDALARAKLHLARVQAAAQDGGPVEQARLALATAEMARARGRAAAPAWSRAALACEALALPYPAAIARWREAECRAQSGDRDGAAGAAREALRAAHALGSQWLERELRGLADRARLPLEDVAPAHPAAAPEDPFGLTDRERQVLALVAEGATNRQIGAALYMAEKTASVHVSRILAKLDVHGRTEAAAVAHRLHLAAPPGSVTRR
jgi:predicted ATPase/DNA-binding CsgD family transcriptional regulator